MAHPEQAEFIQSCFKRFSLLVDEAVNILEMDLKILVAQFEITPRFLVLKTGWA